MKLKTVLLWALLILPPLAPAQDLPIGHPLPPVAIDECGEMVLENDDIHLRPWSSAQLAGRVRVVQYIAGRRSAKKKNAILIKAIKAARFPADRFQPTTIVNTADELFGSGFIVRAKIAKNQRRYPWAQFVIDCQGTGAKTWRLEEQSSTIIVLDKQGRVRWVKDGALTPQEVRQVMGLIHQLIR